MKFDVHEPIVYIVAHEVGHALGLRHNFAPGGGTTVMGYFKLPRILQIGRQIRIGAPAQPYDVAVVQHVYLGAPLDLKCPPIPSASDETASILSGHQYRTGARVQVEGRANARRRVRSLNLP